MDGKIGREENNCHKLTWYAVKEDYRIVIYETISGTCRHSIQVVCGTVARNQTIHTVQCDPTLGRHRINDLVSSVDDELGEVCGLWFEVTYRITCCLSWGKRYVWWQLHLFTLSKNFIDIDGRCTIHLPETATLADKRKRSKPKST